MRPLAFLVVVGCARTHPPAHPHDTAPPEAAEPAEDHVVIEHDAERIQERGLFLQPVTYPAVPKHRSRLRVSVSAAHTEEDLEKAVQVIAGVLREAGLCR